MTPFLLISAAMLLLALFTLFYGTAPVQTADEHEAINLEVLRDQSKELVSDVQHGTLDQADYLLTQRELDIRAAQILTTRDVNAERHLNPRWTIWPVVIGISVTAVLLYAMLGTPSGLQPTQVTLPPAPMVQTAPTDQQIEAMVSRLAGKLQSSPDDAEGWTMLARSYETLRRFDLAVDAYRHLIKLTPRNANIYNDYAVTLAMSSNQSLSGEPEKLIHQALAIEPDNIQALALLGSAAFERKEYGKAIVPWKRILELIPGDSTMARSIAGNIRKAEVLGKK